MYYLFVYLSIMYYLLSIMFYVLCIIYLSNMYYAQPRQIDK